MSDGSMIIKITSNIKLNSTLLRAGFLSVLLMLTGCITHSDSRKLYQYICVDGFEFSVEYSQDSDKAVYRDVENKIRLKRIPSASGVRYSDGENFILDTKGLMASIRIESEIQHAECVGDNSLVAED